MKIVQSLWFNTDQSNYNAGWLDVRYHLMSWSLSSLLLKRKCKTVELVTDRIGYDLLIDKLVLPYSSVNQAFDRFEIPMADQFWALKKIYAYSIHDEPFVFVDGDVFYFDPLCISNKKIIAQNFETDFSFYHPVQNVIKQSCAIENTYLDNNQLNAVNTGVIGGDDHEFFKEFRNEVFKFAAINEHNLYKIVNDYKIETKYVNVWLEQYFLYNYAKHVNKEFSFYLEDEISVEDDYRYLADFTNLPSSQAFLHVMHLAKVNPTVCEQLDY